jgi:large subunit ribosomal protein L30
MSAEGQLLVRQQKGVAGRPWTQRLVLKGLGLRGPGSEVVVANERAIRGMIRKVLHLVSVDAVPAGTEKSGTAKPAAAKAKAAAPKAGAAKAGAAKESSEKKASAKEASVKEAPEKSARAKKAPAAAGTAKKVKS